MLDPEKVARAICRHSSHAPNGTCAAICMDEPGDVPAKGCRHATRIHGTRVDAAIRAVIEGLMEPSEEAMNAWAALAVERIKRHATGNPDGLTPEEGAAQCFRAMLRAELRRLNLGEKE